ncbi:hypothetical protein ACFQGT_12665 [Natrialbaceae archaeon GCM10025810]|uniref:hypothetical protein n=1 Tax=Halovalidus salilacus TaxID=3075124 RepID=UPI0036074791
MTVETAVALNVIVDNLTEMIGLFTDVALGEGLAPLLVAAGGILIVASVGVFGVLTLGAIGSLFTSD